MSADSVTARAEPEVPVRSIIPPALRAGDQVAIVSTSSPVTEDQLNLVASYVKGLGYQPVPMPAVLCSGGYTAGSAEQRAEELIAAFTDPDIRLILPVNGGFGACHLLDILDYDAIRASPTIFTGASDPSLLSNAIFARTGVVTIHGATGVTFFNEPVYDFEVDEFLRVVTGPIAGRVISGPHWRVARRGDFPVQGRLVGGGLSPLRSLVGTPYMPPLAGCVLMLEEFNMTWAEIDRVLTHLRNAGVFDDIVGLVHGVPVECTRGDSADRGLDDLVTRSVPGSFPIITNVHFGHGKTVTSLPIGTEVRIEMDGDQPSLLFCEDAVAG
jgi:muramoyltetrapeptide carboxypeptidase